MLIRRALALSALAVATAFAGDAALAPVAGGARTRVLTLHEAIEMALRDNIDIQWHKTDLKLQDAQIRLAWGDFDPVFSLNSSYQFVRTPQNPSTITTADTAQQILLQQQFLAQAQSAVNAQPTPIPLPSPERGHGHHADGQPRRSRSRLSSRTRTSGTRSISRASSRWARPTRSGVEADHLRDTVLNLNQHFLPSDTFFAGITLDQPLLQGFRLRLEPRLRAHRPAEPADQLQ